MGKFAKTNGGVSEHAIQRMIGQYSSPLSKREMRRIIREEKRASKVNNGYFKFSKESIRKLKAIVKSDKILIAIVCFGTIVTIEEK